jgi:hypothetical protein
MRGFTRHNYCVDAFGRSGLVWRSIVNNNCETKATNERSFMQPVSVKSRKRLALVRGKNPNGKCQLKTTRKWCDRPNK